ncbi:MAG: ABC transporter permease [Jatrophihabitantaceae bacterium]
MRRRRSADGLGTPAVLVPPAVIGVLFLFVPTLSILIRAPWSSLGTIYRHNDVAAALRLSILTSLQSLVLSLVFGVPLAWVLARMRFPGLGVLRAIVTIPLVLPPVVGGVALFLALGRFGVVGRYLYSWFGLTLPFTQHGVVLAETFVAMPFLVVTVEGAFRTADRALEEAAATLGANRTRTFSRVTLPLIVPSLVAGSVLCWARALGEFGATVLFGGAVTGRTQTMPTLVLYAFQHEPEDAVALSLPLMLVALIVLGALRDKWLRPAASA